MGTWRRDRGRRITLPCVVLWFGANFSGCVSLPPLSDDTIKVFSDSGEGTVLLEGVDGAARYDHPVTISEWRLRAMLRRVHYREDSDTALVPLFEAKELDFLVGPVAESLARSIPSTRVAFRVISGEKVDGRGQGPRLTSGRIFVHEGKFHLVIGNCNTPLDDEGDRGRIFIGDETLRIPAGSWKLVLLDEAGQTEIPPGSALPPNWLEIELRAALDGQP